MFASLASSAETTGAEIGRMRKPSQKSKEMRDVSCVPNRAYRVLPRDGETLTYQEDALCCLR